MGLFDGKVVWITGGGSGIGHACALRFAAEGARVAVSGRRRDRLDAVVAEIEAAGGSALAVPCDVTAPAEVDAAVAAVVARFGQLDVAVANAGFSISGRVWEVPHEQWARQLDLNVLGLVSTVRSAMPELVRTQGRVVLIGSVAAFVYAPKNGAYNASKAAVHAIGVTLSNELEKAGQGVTCTTVHPGFVESEIAKVRNDGSLDPERRDNRPRQLMWTAEAAARVIVPAVHRRVREFPFTAHGKFALWLSRWAPWVLRFALTR